MAAGRFRASARRRRRRTATWQWSVRGELRPVAGGEPEIWLHLAAHARVWRDCQRCLQPVALDLDVSRPRCVSCADEATASALDADSEDDVLVREPPPRPA